MKNRFTYVFVLIIAVISFSSCHKNKEEKFIDPTTGKQEKIHIIRFEKELFDKPLPDMTSFLRNLQKKYPEMFQTSVDNQEYKAIITKFITDSHMQEVMGVVQRNYPDLNFLENDLTDAFARLQQIYKDIALPKRVFSLIFGPAEFSYSFENKVYTNGDYSTVSLDMYSMEHLKNHPYYKNIPEYMIETLKPNYIAPDYMRMYLENVIFKDIPLKEFDPDCTLLDCIIEDGKYSYFLSQILPKYQTYEILHYTEQQYNWCNDNERLIWGFIIQNKLLYEKDRSKYLGMISEAPQTKGLPNSPSKTGNYIGYRIVDKFMKENKISLDSLMHIKDSQQILQLSNYKPKKGNK